MMNKVKYAMMLSIALIAQLSFAGGESSGGGFFNQILGDRPVVDNGTEDDSYSFQPAVKYPAYRINQLSESIYIPDFLFSWMKSGVTTLEFVSDGNKYFMGIVEASEDEITAQGLQGDELYIEIAQYEEQISCHFVFVTTSYLRVICK